MNDNLTETLYPQNTDPENPVHLQLPAEHPQASKGKVGLLLRHMYGTQRAADGWQQEYSSTLIGLGFTQGVASPRVFWHPGRRLV